MLSHALIHPAPPKFRASDQDQNSPLFESLVCDTHTAALLTAAITSAVNGFKSPAAAYTQAQLQMYLPRDPTVGLALGRWAWEAGLQPQTIDAVLAFFADLEPARRQLGRYFNDANTLGPERAVALHRFALASAWRGICPSAIAAIGLLGIEAKYRLPDFYRANGDVLSQLLAAAAAGEAPCIDKAGQPFLPALPQRRRSSRRSLGQSGLITIHGKTIRGFVRDVSTGGFGLESVPILEKGADVAIELSTGRRFAGKVAWYARGRAGIIFDRPLTPNDPMLWG